MTNKTWDGHTRTHAKLFHRFTSSGTKTAVAVSYCVWPPCLDSAVFSCRLRLTNTWKRIHSVLTADSRCTAKRRRGLTTHELKCPCQFFFFLGGGGNPSCQSYSGTRERPVGVRVWQGASAESWQRLKRLRVDLNIPISIRHEEVWNESSKFKINHKTISITNDSFKLIFQQTSRWFQPLKFTDMQLSFVI